MVLARSLSRPGAPETPWLASGTTITPGVIASLHEEGIYDVWVQDPFLAFLEDLYSPDLSAGQLRWCDILRRGFQAQAQRVDAGVQIERCGDTAQALARLVLAKLATPAFERTLLGVEPGVLQHGTEVACLAMMLGLHLEEYLATQRRRGGAAGRRSRRPRPGLPPA